MTDIEVLKTFKINCFFFQNIIIIIVKNTGEVVLVTLKKVFDFPWQVLSWKESDQPPKLSIAAIFGLTNPHFPASTVQKCLRGIVGD